MNLATSSLGELRDRVSAGDPEAERRFEREYTPLLKLSIRRARTSRSAAARVAAFFSAGTSPRTAPDDRRGESALALLAQRICRRAIGKLQQGRRATRHDTVGPRGGWLTARFW
ncbi:MAG TPA: hypothetical protein VMV69_14870 [Pirellulales bacterium]|nr:hypothetical protein [Pirellulales bacterium]